MDGFHERAGGLDGGWLPGLFAETQVANEGQPVLLLV